MQLPPPPLKVLRWSILIRIILVCTMVVHIMFIIHPLRMPLSLSLSLLTIEPIFSLRFREAIDFGTGKASKEFLGELVRDGLACG